jgi:hypothetical protein
MGRIILVTGGDKRSVGYTPRSVAHHESHPDPPFWLDFLSPSERLLYRLSIPFKLDPRAVKASLSRHRKPGCEDFGHCLFIQTSLLEPSRQSLFIQHDLKIFLGSRYLITIHKRSTPLRCLLSSLQLSGFTQTGTLLLILFDNLICGLMHSLCSKQNNTDLPVHKCDQPERNPVWWRLMNFRAALLRDVNLLHEIAFVGGRFFNPDDRGTFGSVKAKICLLCDTIDGLLSGMDPSVNATFVGGEKKIL